MLKKSSSGEQFITQISGLELKLPWLFLSSALQLEVFYLFFFFVGFFPFSPFLMQFSFPFKFGFKLD